MKGERLVEVLYGSETGNAEEIAKRLHSELPQHGFTAGALIPMKSYKDVGIGTPIDPQQTEKKLYLFVVSTTGDGDPPQNASAMMRFLRKKTNPTDMLKGMYYTILGLGDTNYTHFCNGSKRLEKALKSYGAESIYNRGEADDEVGLHIVVEPWIDGLWDALNKYFQGTSGGMDVKDPLPSSDSVKTGADDPSSTLEGVPALPNISCEVVSVAPGEGEKITESESNGDAAIGLFGTAKSAHLMTATHSDKRVWHMAIEMEDTVDYQPGEAFAIYVQNSEEDVVELLRLLQEDGERIVAVNSKGACLVDARPLKLLIGAHCDISSPPSKRLLRTLAEYCSEPSEKQTLLLWSSRTGRTTYEENIVKPKSSAIDVLRKMPSCVPPVAVLVDLLPKLQPRTYSAVSAAEVDQNNLQIAFSVVEYEKNGSKRRGVATGYLEDICRGLSAGEGSFKRLRMERRPLSSFFPPKELSTSYLMIGPGTGVAPFVGFLRQRQSRIGSVGSSSAHLFFGCRRPDEDFLYQDELKDFEADGTLTKLFVSFSREQEKKFYVQDRLREQAELVFDLLSKEDSSRIYICGDGGAMVKGVVAALEYAFESQGGLSQEDAKTKVASLEKSGRLLKDVWFWG